MTQDTTPSVTTPGYKTPAFWATLALTLLSALISSGALVSIPVAAKIVSFVIAALSALGFGATHTVVKSE